MEKHKNNSRAIPNSAIVGCGNIGSRFDELNPALAPITHASAYLKNSGVRLIAAADVDPKRLLDFGSRRNVEKLYKCHKELLASESIQILSICSHTDSRLRIVQDALEAGVRTIICEKPLAASISEAEEIVRLSKEFGATILVNYIRRWNSGIDRARALLSSPTVKIQAVTAYYEKGLLNNGSHVLDLLSSFWGTDIEPIQKSTVHDDRAQTSDPSITARLRFGHRGQFFEVQLNAVDHRIFSIFEIDVLHNHGRIKILNAGDTIQFFAIVPDRDCPDFPVLTLETELTSQTTNSMSNLIENAIQVFHGTSAPKCGAQEALETLRIIESVRGKN